MTCAAIGIHNIGAVFQGKRLVYLMAGYAVFKFLAGCMRIMTVQAIRFEAVFVVAEGTVNLGMGADICINFLHYLGMAGVAGCLDIA